MILPYPKKPKQSKGKCFHQWVGQFSPSHIWFISGYRCTKCGKVRSEKGK